MSFLELAKKRYSSRKYTGQKIEQEKIDLILEAARIAPSAANCQPWQFIVIRDDENIKKIASTYKREWIKLAPVIIVICGDHRESWKRADGKDYCDIDISIAVDHMTLEASDLELGTCWVCNFDKNRCSEILNLPSYIEPIVLLPIGYPDDEVNIDRHNSLRKNSAKIVHWEKF